MDKNSVIELNRCLLIENICIVFACAITVGCVAIGTGSLHCMWGLIFLAFMNARFIMPKDA